jgi:ABC-type branched-subunit amino acid transport system substrate-binding protein
MPAHRLLLRLSAVLLLGFTVAACGSGGGGSVPDTEPRVTTTGAPNRSDGVLRIGLLVPRSGGGASLGEPLVGVAEQAVADIEKAGLGGFDIELVVRDEGPDTATARSAVDEFIDEVGVDAIVGPLSSSVALGVLPTLIANRIGVCSPAATTASLTNFPDDGLFVRTTPSDTMIALAMAQTVAQTGVDATTLVYPDDPFGRDFAIEIRRALVQQSITVADELPYDTTDDDYRDDVDELESSEPRVITMIGDKESGGRFLSAILASGTDADVVVNDALADADLSGDPNLARPTRSRITGIAIDAGRVPFATATIDCINLLAMSATQAESDVADFFMPLMIPTSRGGSACREYDDCLTLIDDGLNVDYNGPSGLLTLTANGDPGVATFVTFGFDDDGRASYRTSIGVISAP